MDEKKATASTADQDSTTTKTCGVGSEGGGIVERLRLGIEKCWGQNAGNKVYVGYDIQATESKMLDAAFLLEEILAEVQRRVNLSEKQHQWQSAVEYQSLATWLDAKLEGK